MFAYYARGPQEPPVQPRALNKHTSRLVSLGTTWTIKDYPATDTEPGKRSIIWGRQSMCVYCFELEPDDDIDCPGLVEGFAEPTFYLA